MKINSIKEIKNLSGKKIIVRSDFNVAFSGNKIKEIYKIEKGFATIKYLRERGAKIILLSHLGRPVGYDKKFSLKPIFNYIKKEFKKNIYFIDISDKIFSDQKKIDKIKKIVESSKNGSIFVFQNVRFINGEEKNKKNISKIFSGFGDYFVLDGFAVSHRPSSTVIGIAEFLPAYAGLLMEEEIKGLSKFLSKPKKPLVVVIGGNKMETKMPMLKKLLGKASQVLICGGIANTFLLAQRYNIGASIFDKKEIKTAGQFLKNKKIIIPVDYVVGDKEGKKIRVIEIGKNKKIVDAKMGIYDIGPKTISLFAKYLKKANTLIWNGAAGMFEVSAYSWGSKSIARLFASRAKGMAYGATGGGETVQIINKLNLMDDIDLVSTGGGAMLSFLSGEKLPGVSIVTKK
jgi:phosphoglycerate kinase